MIIINRNEFLFFIFVSMYYWCVRAGDKIGEVRDRGQGTWDMGHGTGVVGTAWPASS